MVTISGQPVGPDGLGGAFHNSLESRRAWVWRSLGSQQVVLDGLVSSNVPGLLQRSYSPGMALLEERNSAGSTGATGRGYTAGFDADDGAQVVTFDPPDASARSDAVVIAVVDTSVGAAALGTAVSEVGPQLVVIRGVSGTTTPRTDAQINTAVGSGGWLRLDDVAIAPGNTEVVDSAVTRNPAAVRASQQWMATATITQSIPSLTDTHIRYNSVAVNNGGAFSNVTDVATIVVPGWYNVSATVALDQDASNNGYLALTVNGNRVAVAPSGTLGASVNAMRVMTVTAPLYLNAGDVIDTRVWHNAGTAINVNPANGPVSFAGVLVGAA